MTWVEEWSTQGCANVYVSRTFSSSGIIPGGVLVGPPSIPGTELGKYVPQLAAARTAAPGPPPFHTSPSRRRPISSAVDGAAWWCAARITYPPTTLGPPRTRRH